MTPQPNTADYAETVHDLHIGEGVCRKCIAQSDSELLDRLPAWTGDPDAPCWSCVEMIAEGAWRDEMDAPE